MPHLTHHDLAHSEPVPETVNALIVGAGMAGLYCAWRVLKQDPRASVIIFEQSGRTGGRLDSDLVHLGEGQTIKEEEGGMRFTFDLMENLMALFLTLRLDDEVVPFPMNGSGVNRLCFRGTSFNTEESAEDQYAIWSRLYKLADSEKGINPSDIIDTVFNRILAVHPHFKTGQWTAIPNSGNAFGSSASGMASG